MLLLFTATLCVTRAQPERPSEPRTIWSGVFSDFQARRGEKVASLSCGGCHGPDLDGGDSGPKLAGPAFLNNWADKTVWDLFDFIRTSMPEDAPGSLSPENTASILAYILELNHADPGPKDLPIDQAALGQIRIVQPASPK